MDIEEDNMIPFSEETLVVKVISTVLLAVIVTLPAFMVIKHQVIPKLLSLNLF